MNEHAIRLILVVVRDCGCGCHHGSEPPPSAARAIVETDGETVAEVIAFPGRAA